MNRPLGGDEIRKRKNIISSKLEVGIESSSPIWASLCSNTERGSRKSVE